MPTDGFEVDFKYKKYGSDTNPTIERVTLG